MKKIKIVQLENDLLSSKEQMSVQGGYGFMDSCVKFTNFCHLFENGCTDSMANNPPLDRSSGNSGGGGGAVNFQYPDERGPLN